MSKFEEDIIKFNKMYKLPVATHPTLDQLRVDPLKRLRDFKNILSQELDEIDEIVQKIACRQNGMPYYTLSDGGAYLPTELEILTDLADLLGDIQVYCSSEMAKFGLPQEKILDIIMNSNFSKLGSDGQPIYDERGKVQKGPDYWKPEPTIKAMLAELIGKVLSEEVAQQEGRQIGAFDPLPGLVDGGKI